MKSIQNTLKLADDRDDAINEEITKFITKASSILFKMYISDPKIVMDLTVIGTKIKFSQTKVDSFDGFIKQGHDCISILPSLYKESNNGDQMLKPSVLPLDYEFP
jgi:hypothetical protein